MNSPPQLTLRPVCVGVGDAIFITIEHNGEKDAYLVDGSEGEDNVKMIENTYDELREDGFTLRRIIVTHPDKDHYRGIGDVLEFTGVNTPPVLLTNQFKCKLKNKKKEPADPTQKEQADPAQKEPANKLKKFCDTITETFGYSEFSVGNIEYIENRALSTPFKVAYKSSTSDLVLYKTDNETVEKPGKDQRQIGEFCKPEQDRYNESSIVTTITLKDNSKILACLTGDAFFDSADQIATFLLDRKITVFQVPHHGSKHNSNFEFYVQIAGNTQYYLISCGHHGSYDFPHKEVFTAIRKATVAKEKEGATIVLTDGTHLNGERMSSFRGCDYEPSVSYWDPHLRRSDSKLIEKDFLQFTFSSKGDLVYDIHALPNLIQWSIEGYKKMKFSCGKKILRGMHFKASNKRHLKVVEGVLKTEECQGDECNKSIDGHIGLPAPTDPCTWDNRVIMVRGTNDLVFLQLTTGENIIIHEHKYENVQKGFEERITSKVYKSCLRNACEYKNIVSLLSKAITTIIFRTIYIPARKLELIEEVNTALETTKDTDIYSMQTITEKCYEKNERDVVMSLLKLEHEIRQSLFRNRKYDGKELLKKLDEIETNNRKSLLKYFPQDIISFGKQRFCFFKCYKVPWRIVYGTISDNGNVNWPDQHVHNSLQVYTPMTPLDF